MKLAIESRYRRKSLSKGLGAFLFAAAGYALSFAGTLTMPWYLKPVFSVLTGLFIAVLFVVGHDACHRALTGRRWLDAGLARLSFLPSYWPYEAWWVGHNYYHHGFTLVRDVDYTWQPMSLEAYRGASPLRRWLERHYRSWPGLATHWIHAIWWRHGVLPRSSDWTVLKKRQLKYVFDAVSVGVFLMGQVYLVVLLAGTGGGGALRWGPTTSAVVLSVGFPFWISSFIGGLAVLVQHTHPDVRWYRSVQERDRFAAQVQGTVHFRFPWPFEHLFLNIMEHTAHHADPRIPFHELPAAQRALEATYGSEVRTVPFSLRAIEELFATCQLHDFDTGRWLDFEGRVTAVPGETVSQTKPQCTSRSRVSGRRPRSGLRGPPPPGGRRGA